MGKKISVFILLFSLSSVFVFAQSTNCVTATSMTLVNNTACVNGTTVGAITDNTLYGGCNVVPVNMVWYTYVTTGSTNNFTVTPASLTNAEIVIYLGGCPTTGGILQLCNTAVGSSPVTATWGIPVGTQVWVGIASNAGSDGTFQFCVNSIIPPPTGGQFCGTPIILCNENAYTQTSMTQFGSSGQTPSCFANPTQQDMFIQFTVLQTGLFCWTCNPQFPTTEFDWCLWNVTANCPGTEVCCNYNFAGGSSAGFGQQTQAGTVPCGYNLASGIPSQEFCQPNTLIAGQTYQIQISNYPSDGTGFTLNWTNSTCVISPNANFTINPNTVVCGASVTETITNTSLGGPQVWSYGDNSANYTGTNPPSHTYTTPGTYAITETIGGNCPSTQTHYVNLYAPLAATASATGATCSNCDGTATVNTVSGGDGVYTYLWSNGATTTSISNLCAGSYTVTVSNAACGTSVQQIVNVAPGVPVVAALTNSTNVSCFGGNNGNATVTTSAGNGPFTYLWTPSNQTTATASGLTVGNYSCLITSTDGCTTTVTANITQPTQLVLQTTSVPAGCNQATGSATVTPSGGTGPYDFVWTDVNNNVLQTANNINGANTLNGLAPGTYNILVTDANNCLANVSVIVTGVPGNLTDVMANVPTTCFGSCDGSATCTLNGGQGPFSYLWGANAANQTTQTATNLCAGLYVVHYHDANNCVGVDSIIVTSPPAVTNSVVAVPTTICVGQSSTLTCTAGGGTGAGYTYTWTPAATGNTATVVVSPITTTTYTVVVHDSNGCASPQATVTVTVDPLLNVTLVANPPAVCTGSPSTLTASGSGGNGGPYTYSWLPVGTAGNTTTANVTPAATTTYTVILSDGCSPNDSATVTVTVNPPPVPTFTGTPLVGCAPLNVSFANTTVGSTNCLWSFGDNTTSTNCGPIVAHTYSTPGCYDVSLIVTDGNGCVGTLLMPSYVCVSANVVAQFSASPQPTDIFNSNISFTDLSTGNPITWHWDFGGLDSSNVENPSYFFPNDAAGCYDVVLTANNAANCPGIDTVKVCIDPIYTIYFPNAFTPNNDGINDNFVGVGEGIAKYEMWIFDRWGNMIYYTDDINRPWDGKANGGTEIAQEDVYVWKVNVTDVFGLKHKFIGHVSLIK